VTNQELIIKERHGGQTILDTAEESKHRCIPRCHSNSNSIVHKPQLLQCERVHEVHQRQHTTGPMRGDEAWWEWKGRLFLWDDVSIMLVLLACLLLLPSTRVYTKWRVRKLTGVCMLSFVIVSIDWKGSVQISSLRVCSGLGRMLFADAALWNNRTRSPRLDR
jgi:hypothetical protein